MVFSTSVRVAMIEVSHPRKWLSPGKQELAHFQGEMSPEAEFRAPEMGDRVLSRYQGLSTL